MHFTPNFVTNFVSKKCSNKFCFCFSTIFFFDSNIVGIFSFIFLWKKILFLVQMLSIYLDWIKSPIVWIIFNSPWDMLFFKLLVIYDFTWRLTIFTSYAIIFASRDLLFRWLKTLLRIYISILNSRPRKPINIGTKNPIYKRNTTFNFISHFQTTFQLFLLLIWHFFPFTFFFNVNNFVNQFFFIWKYYSSLRRH